MAEPLSFGGLRSPVSQRGMTKSEPTSRLKHDWIHGKGSEFSRTLFARLYPVDKPNHNTKYTPSFRVRIRLVVPTTEQPSSSQSARHLHTTQEVGPKRQSDVGEKEGRRTRLLPEVRTTRSRA